MNAEKPEPQGISSRSGTRPPVEHQFQPGVSGKPGRSAGASVKEWINAFGELNEDQLCKIARDGKGDWTRRAAAERILRTLESPDLADFAGLLDGTMTLEQLRASGVNTELIKKFRERRHVTDSDEVEITRELELHDRSGLDFDRIMDRTNGKPKQKLEHSGDMRVVFHPITLDDREMDDETTALAASLISRLEQIEPDAPLRKNSEKLSADDRMVLIPTDCLLSKNMKKLPADTGRMANE